MIATMQRMISSWRHVASRRRFASIDLVGSIGFALALLASSSIPARGATTAPAQTLPAIARRKTTFSCAAAFVVILLAAACGMRPPGSATTSVLPTPALAYETFETSPCTLPINGAGKLAEIDPPLYAWILTDTAHVPPQIARVSVIGGGHYELGRVDYTRHVVLAIEWGKHRSCGDTLRVGAIRLVAGTIHVAVSKGRPEPGHERQAAESSAYAFIILPRSAIDRQRALDIVVTDDTGKRHAWTLAPP